MSSETSKANAARIVIDFLPGVEPKDAESFARGFIRRHGYSISRSAYRVTKVDGGSAYEIHEGGPQRALVPAALKLLDSQEEVRIDSGTRQVRIHRTAAGPQALLLPESDRGEPDVLKPGPRLKPYEQLYTGFINFGAALLSLSLILLTCSLVLHGMLGNFEVRHTQSVAAEKARNLPLRRFPSAPADGYVAKHVFKGGNWSSEIKRPGDEDETPPAGAIPVPESGVLGEAPPVEGPQS